MRATPRLSDCPRCGHIDGQGRTDRYVRLDHCHELFRQLEILWGIASAKGHDSAHGYAVALQRLRLMLVLSETVTVWQYHTTAPTDMSDNDMSLLPG